MRFLDTSRIRTRFDERVIAADGTELSVDLYLPTIAGRYPVLLQRTAADNNRAGRPGISSPPSERWKILAAHGYIVATADVRGRGDSDGTFQPFIHEAADGAATVHWLRRLEECNGKIGLFGSGYGAFCAWAAAVGAGQVDALVSISPFGAIGEGLCHNRGAVRLDWLFWMHLIGGRSVQSASLPEWPNIHRHLPLREQHEALGRDDIWWRDWLEHLQPGDEYWDPVRLADRIAMLGVPGLHVTGWWDGQLSAARYYYEAACRSRAPQRLIIGPWDTASVRRPVSRVGGFDFGPRAMLDVDETMEVFFREHLYGGNAAEARSRIFLTGCNEWLDDEGWPPDSASVLELHFSSIDGANTRRGDGMLCRKTAQCAGFDRMRHNPEVPVDFQPQFAGFATGALAGGLVLDQNHVTARDEALVYTAESLGEAVIVAGRPTVILTIFTMAADADLYVLLSDVFPGGARDLHLGHVAIRLGSLPSFRPGLRLEVALELEWLAHEFLPGHRIRITVVPSLFPLYARNAQTGDYAGSRVTQIADVELHHGEAGSRLLLPVLSPKVSPRTRTSRESFADG